MKWDPVEAFDRIAKTLMAALQDAGRGSVEDADRRIGQRPGYLRAACRRDRRSLKLMKLLRVLALLRIHPLSFFRMVFTEEAVGDEAGTDGAYGEDWADEEVSGVEASEGAAFVREGAELLDPVEAFGARAQAASRKGAAARIAFRLERLEGEVRSAPSAAARCKLTELDAGRYDDHRAVLRPAEELCRDALDGGDVELAVRAAGVLGSTLRMGMDLDGAAVVLWGAHRAAERFDLAAVAADLLQRMVYVAADQGDHRLGLALAERAMVIYTDLKDRTRIGQAQVVRGIMLGHLDCVRQAIRAHTAALANLPASEGLHRYGALQALSFLYMDLGEGKEALRYLQEAEPYVVPGRHNRGRYLWLRAAFATHVGDTAMAEAHYREALEIFGTTFPADKTVCAIELIHLLLKASRPLDAYTVGCEMRAAAFKLPRGTVVDDVAWELIRMRRMTAERIWKALEKIGHEGSCLIRVAMVPSRHKIALRP